MPFFFLFILYYYLPFLDGKKKALHNIFAFNSNSPQIEHIAKKNYKTQKEKSKCEEPTNKTMKILKYFWNFLISKWGSFDQISTRVSIKIMVKA